MLTSCVNRRNVGGNGHNNGGSHFLCVDGFDGLILTFGDAPVSRFDEHDTIAELMGTIKSSSITGVSSNKSIDGVDDAF